MWQISIFGFDFYFLFFNFMIYSFLGWIYESTVMSIKDRKLTNRGFLTGPYIPIYGLGGTTIYVVLYPVRTHGSLVFLLGMLVATVLEYAVSWLMETLFHARWWDYSEYKFSFQGRIWLLASIFWGFLSLLMMDLIQPVMNKLIGAIPRDTGEIVGYILISIFTIDLILTVISTIQMDKSVSKQEKLRRELMEYLESTKLYDLQQLVKEKYENSKMADLMEYAKGKAAEKYEDYHVAERFRELEAKIRSYIVKSEDSVPKPNLLQIRILKAFPKLKFKNRDVASEEWRARINEKRVSEKKKEKS